MTALALVLPNGWRWRRTGLGRSVLVPTPPNRLNVALEWADGGGWVASFLIYRLEGRVIAIIKAGNA